MFACETGGPGLHVRLEGHICMFAYETGGPFLYVYPCKNSDKASVSFTENRENDNLIAKHVTGC